MDKLPEKTKMGRMALDVLVATALWSVVLLLMDYPREDWLGVIVVGYVCVWIARAIVTYPLSLLMEDLLGRVRTLADAQGILLPESPSSIKSLPLKAQLQFIAFALPLIFAFMGLSVILTGPIIGFASLAPLANGTMPIAIGVVIGGSAITGWRIGSMYFSLARSQRLLNPEKIHRHGQYVDRLGRLAVAMSL